MSEQSDRNDAGGSSSGVAVSGPRPGRGRSTTDASDQSVPSRDPVQAGRPPGQDAAGPWQSARSGLWRVAVAEHSMTPALAAGDWLLLDPTLQRWPQRGSIVVFREPGSGVLAIKRIAAGPGDRVRISAGILHLGRDQAWLLGDNRPVSIDSRRYGPVNVDALVGRAWFRYAPLRRIGPIRRAQPAAQARPRSRVRRVVG